MTRPPAAHLAAALAVVAVVFGVLFDISWDSTIGRDSFWSPPHMTSFLGGVLGGLAGLWALARRSEPGVRVAGVVAPLGAWVLIWGALAMQGAAHLDEWWRAAYGLDSGVGWPPPQTLLIAGTFALQLGAMTLTASWQNRTGRSSLLFAIEGAMVLAFMTILLTDFGLPNLQRTSRFYLLAAGMFPAGLAIAARGAHARWGATRAALAYTLFYLLLVWIFPLFPAKPLLGPIYHPVDRLAPPSFPLLLVVPALAFDALVAAKRRGVAAVKNDWLLAAAAGIAFFVLLLAAQWPFAAFLLSPAADNPVFAGGGRYWPYWRDVGAAATRFWGAEQLPMTAGAAAEAIALAMVSSRVGLWIGAGIAAVRR